MDVAEATRFTLERARAGEDTISVTGNVLRDYLTDLFPILELGTSAKMLSIVPLMNGGGLFETGAGGSAPEARPAVPGARTTCAGTRSASSSRSRSRSRCSPRRPATRARSCSADALDRATGRLLEENRSPSRRVGELDNRGSHFYLALLLGAGARRARPTTPSWPPASRRWPSSSRPTRTTIVAELNAVQGEPVDIGGYYRPDPSARDARDAPERDAQRRPR